MDGPFTQPAETLDETGLLARLRSGDEDAYEHLVRAYGGKLLSVARRFLRSPDDAQDAVQDAFLCAFRSIGSFEGSARLSTWLHRIVINSALMKLRSRRRTPETSIEDLLPKFVEDGHQVRPSTEWSRSGDEAVEQRETREVVRRCIDQLPESYRTVLLLRDIEEVDTEEAARILGVSENAVKVRLHRARQGLRTLLDAYFREGKA
jgi:RNA polymerase sigma-70 factor (ECF subfamily)